MVLASSFAFLLLSACRHSAADPTWNAGYSVRKVVVDACIKFTEHRFLWLVINCRCRKCHLIDLAPTALSAHGLEIRMAINATGK